MVYVDTDFKAVYLYNVACTTPLGKWEQLLTGHYSLQISCPPLQPHPGGKQSADWIGLQNLLWDSCLRETSRRCESLAAGSQAESVTLAQRALSGGEVQAQSLCLPSLAELWLSGRWNVLFQATVSCLITSVSSDQLAAAFFCCF